MRNRSKYLGRIAESLDEVLDLVLHVVDAERRVHARDFERAKRPLAPAGDFADQVEVLLAETLGEFVDDGREQPARPVVHVLDRVDAEAVEIGERDPELKRAAQGDEGIRRAVVVDRPRALADVLQRFEVAFAELRLEIPVANFPLARERLGRLQVGRPDRGVGKVRRGDRTERQGRVARGVAITQDAVGRAVRLPAGFLAHDVAAGVAHVAPQLLRLVVEDIAGVVEDDVENDADAVVMRGLHDRHEIGPCAKAWIDVEKILDAIPVVGLLRGHLLEDGADPDGGNPEAFEVADFRLEAAERAAGEPVAGIHPALPIDRGRSGVAPVRGLQRRRRSGRDHRAAVVPVARLVPIREPVEHQEVKHLVFPRGRRGKEGASCRQRVEVDIGDALLHGPQCTRAFRPAREPFLR